MEKAALVSGLNENPESGECEVTHEKRPGRVAYFDAEM